MKWNHYFAAVVFGGFVFVAAGAPLWTVVAGASAVAVINLVRFKRARQ
jgi:hypothetical protein